MRNVDNTVERNGAADMKGKFEKVIYTVLFAVLLIPVFTTDASAVSESQLAFSRTPLGIFLSALAVFLAVLAFIVIKLSDRSFDKRRKNSQFFKDDSTGHFFYNSDIDGINMMSGGTNVFDPRLSDAENIMLKQFESQAKLRHPDPVSANCPNCGAPIIISDKAFCPYCRSNVVDKIVYNNQDEKPKPISPENYNPKRYYDENVTGYEPRSMGSSSGDDRNNDYSFTSERNGVYRR